MSIGEDRVRVSFNPSDSSPVYHIKRKTAELIDLCEQLKLDRHGSPEELRLWALAQTHYEDAAMWAVKAATA
jgi:hypothetical protein